MEKLREIVREGRRVGEEDPRRIVHSFKVGVALVLVSSFYYYQPSGPFTDYFGINAMWAVMTVVVVFEFSVGATLSKGLNRGVATLVGGGLALGAHQLASFSGRTIEPILLATFVFVTGVMEKLREIVREGRRVGEEDPRRIVHSFKVGVALVLVSSFYYYQPSGPFTDYFGINAMWAVMTVVVVFEFSVGATLSKGLNRGVATLVAGGLALGAHQLASFSGRTIEPILLATFVFVTAALATFVRFFPRVKETFDYRMLIFILTFSLISLSQFRDEEILDLAESRLSTVLVGGVSCILISIFVCPVWAGQDLHSLLISNLDTLSHFLQVVEKRRSNLERYKSVLNSKSDEDTLIPIDIKKKLEEPFRRMSMESGKALKEASISLKKMMKSSSYDIHIINSQSACKALSTLLKSGILNDVEPLQMVSLLTTVSLLNDIVHLTEKISESVRELASAASFKNKMKPTEPTVTFIGCSYTSDLM
ncbi:hypothetical protein DY000_02054531 [Brassica cretica]|uniref:Aluminum-activated malate transporter n=1 Tax=Brassica cretica TaxID=69181 RepID=A0ABQ7A906_BRACR|nr:hypothetical protein DY000_02054531 [Brassica cretica]